MLWGSPPQFHCWNHLLCSYDWAKYLVPITMVHLTGGNRSGLTGYRSNRSGPVPVWAGTKPAQNQN